MAFLGGVLKGQSSFSLLQITIHDSEVTQEESAEELRWVPCPEDLGQADVSVSREQRPKRKVVAFGILNLAC